MLYMYLNILFHSFILQKRCVCVLVCAQGGHRMGVGLSGCLRGTFLTRVRCVEVQTFENAKSPFCCRCSAPCFSQSRWRSQVESHRTPASKLLNVQNGNMDAQMCQTHNFDLRFPPQCWKWERHQAPSACWVKIIQKGASVNEGCVGMANRRLHSKAVCVGHNQPAACLSSDTNWQRRVTSDSQQTLQWWEPSGCWGATCAVHPVLFDWPTLSENKIIH